MTFKCLAAHLQYSLPVEALNVIVKLSKSVPVEVNNSTIELHFLSAFSCNFLSFRQKCFHSE